MKDAKLTYNNLNQLTGNSPGGAMIFSGTVSKYSTVTVGGNPASLDASNNFRGLASVTTGTNTVAVVARDVDSNVSTNNYQVVVPSSSSSSYTYDDNGNLTSDGSRAFSWDAKNELVKITHADTSYTAFTYNGSGARVKIQEYNSSHSLTSTKQYVGGEERDGSNLVVKRFFSSGEQRISGATATNYFYTTDHLGSIREVMANDGTTIAARYAYDPYGRATKVSGSLDCDFQFTGYYYHAASGLLLSATRAYDPNTGTWISRDPLGEAAGLNLYSYCGGNPICNVDRDGKYLIPLIITGVIVLSIGIFAYNLYQLNKAAEANAATQVAAQNAMVDPNNPNQQQAAQDAVKARQAYPSQVLIPAANAAMSAPGTSVTGPIDVPSDEEADAALALARKAAEEAADKAAEPKEPATPPQAPSSNSPCVDTKPPQLPALTFTS